MTASAPTTDLALHRVDPTRRTARAAGILYLLTFVSMPALALYQHVRRQSDFVLGSGSATGVLWAAFSEVVVAVACVGTAVVLFPVVRRQNETAALGFVASRIAEGTLIVVGVVSVLTAIALRKSATVADPDALLVAGRALSDFYDWTFLLSQSLLPVVNALCLGITLYRSRLVPRALPLTGLIGAPMLLLSDIAVFFGLLDRASPLVIIGALPVAVWELSLGIYLTVKGFRPSAVATLYGRPVG